MTQTIIAYKFDGVKSTLFRMAKRSSRFRLEVDVRREVISSRQSNAAFQ